MATTLEQHLKEIIRKAEKAGIPVELTIPKADDPAVKGIVVKSNLENSVRQFFALEETAGERLVYLVQISNYNQIIIIVKAEDYFRAFPKEEEKSLKRKVEEDDVTELSDVTKGDDDDWEDNSDLVTGRKQPQKSAKKK